ncbi:MAG: response regulator transcription factor [Xanthomonadales bacterium]|nr:response regulator transcription factor [Xanthomonadales bacterium]
MNAPINILIVEDDASVRDALADYLGGHGYAVAVAADGRQMATQIARCRPDLVVLDVMLPGEDGLSICRRLAAEGPPVLMLSALGETTDRIVGLELGAADYLAKPFEPRELLARIRAVLRRQDAVSSEPAEQHQQLCFAGWRLDVGERLLRDADGELVSLTAGELDLLIAFAERPGRLLSRQQLMDITHGDSAENFDRAVDLAVSRLRRKLAQVCNDSPIETVRGGGYRFRLPVQRQ